jgi:hypothetical protein
MDDLIAAFGGAGAHAASSSNPSPHRSARHTLRRARPLMEMVPLDPADSASRISGDNSASAFLDVPHTPSTLEIHDFESPIPDNLTQIVRDGRLRRGSSAVTVKSEQLTADMVPSGEDSAVEGGEAVKEENGEDDEEEEEWGAWASGEEESPEGSETAGLSERQSNAGLESECGDVLAGRRR